MNTNAFHTIKSQISILHVIGEYITVKKAGNYWKGHCPFHQEKTASFTVSPDKGIFYCFGCHAHGDIITFIEKMESCSPKEAMFLLAERYHIPVPDGISSMGEKSKSEKQEYFDLCATLTLWLHDQLKQARPVQEYLYNRNINTEIAHKFQLGYFPGGLLSIKKCLHEMNKHNILAKDLVEARILSQGKQVLYSPFEDRLIFPIKDHIGRVCGFGGRIFKKDDQRPKYYNSHENDFFNKGSLLFGLDTAKHEIQKTGTVFLVEGYIDCIAMVQHGFKNTVATLGTACSSEQLRILARYAHTLYVLYDQDAAGHQAILRLAHMSWQESLDPFVVQLPKGDDPASFLQNRGNLNQAIEKAQDICTFFITTMGAEFFQRPLQHKLEIARDMLLAITPIQDELKQELLLHTMSQTIKIPFETLYNEAQRLKKKQKPHHARPDYTSEQPSIPPSPARILLAENIFSAILNNMKLLEEVNLEYLIACMPTYCGTILKKLADQRAAHSTVDSMYFFRLLNEPEKQLFSRYVTQEGQTISSQDFHQLILQLYKKEWKKLVNSIKMKLHESDSTMSVQERQEIINRFLDLQKIMLPHTTYRNTKGD